MLKASRRVIRRLLGLRLRPKRLVYKMVDYRDDTLSFDRYVLQEEDPRVQHELPYLYDCGD